MPAAGDAGRPRVEAGPRAATSSHRLAADLVADPGMTPAELTRDMTERHAELDQKGWLTEPSAIRSSGGEDGPARWAC